MDKQRGTNRIKERGNLGFEFGIQGFSPLDQIGVTHVFTMDFSLMTFALYSERRSTISNLF